MRILFDTNILLDAILSREPFATDAAFLIRAVASNRVTGFASATTLTDVYYLVRRQTRSAETAINAVTDILKLMQICAVDRTIIDRAILLKRDDFEDAVQIACALGLGVDAIVTRDTAGFVGSSILVLSPQNLRQQLEN